MVSAWFMMYAVEVQDGDESERAVEHRDPAPSLYAAPQYNLIS